MNSQPLIQDEIIRADVNDGKRWHGIKKTIKTLAKEFALTESMVNYSIVNQ
jgi:hypothetical protein